LLLLVAVAVAAVMEKVAAVVAVIENFLLSH
jgi:hypothetical protein